MAKIKIVPTRGFFDGGQVFSAGKKYSVDEAAAAVYLREGWAVEAETKESETKESEVPADAEQEAEDTVSDGDGGSV